MRHSLFRCRSSWSCRNDSPSGAVGQDLAASTKGVIVVRGLGVGRHTLIHSPHRRHHGVAVQLHLRWSLAITAAKAVGRSVAVSLMAQMGERLDHRQLHIVSWHLPMSLRSTSEDLDLFDLDVEDLGRLLLQGQRRSSITGGMDTHTTIATQYPSVCGTEAPCTSVSTSSSENAGFVVTQGRRALEFGVTSHAPHGLCRQRRSYIASFCLIISSEQSMTSASRRS